MARKVKIDSLGTAIQDELKLYHQDVVDVVKLSSRDAMKEVVKKTKAFRFKKDTGKFRKNISSRVLDESSTGITMQWYVKAPEHRKAHLLEYGHQTRSGGRTRGYGFIALAEKEGIELQTKKIEEALKK